MGCNCGGSKGSGKKVVYVATFTDGTTKSYGSEIEARMAVVKKGGTYQATVQR